MGFDVTILTDPQNSVVTGRNGPVKLGGIRVWQTDDGYVAIEGINRQGLVLNAGFFLDKVSGKKFLADLCNAVAMSDNS